MHGGLPNLRHAVGTVGDWIREATSGPEVGQEDYTWKY